MKPIASEITGLVSQAQRAANSTGLQRGATASATLPVESESKRRAWLLAHTPAETDQVLASSISSLNVGFAEEGDWRFPPNKPAYKMIHSLWTTGDPANIEAARQKVEGACVAAERRSVEEWLAVLQIATAGQRKSDSTQAATLALYANALMRYPADIAQAVCINLAETCKWFPVLADVLEACDDMYARRKDWLERLSHQ